jgi:hypothetical protein
MNPRNASAKVEEVSTMKPPSEWKSISLGSLSLKDGRELVREYDASFVINERNAKILKAACEYILNNPVDAEGKSTRVSITAYPFYDNVPETKKKFYSHSIKMSAETVSKFGKIEDFVETK